MKNLYIPNPCSESWETMSSREKGRFCSVCSKCVIDFTEKKSHEIESIFKEKQGEDICGRFFSHQLTTENEKYESVENKLFQYIPALFRNHKIGLAIVSMILFLTGCSKPKEKACAVIGEAKIEKNTIPKNDNYILGAPMIQNDSIAKMQKKDSLKLKHQK
ncbi:hypothetical protein HHL23_04690 [Chryseobacterium sp. RP-3-3]|uniref:Uncharacterized protein n=1 Tax=Chryseobacterium antibioticum TaxID=2728847 RepID=A0A7Y0FQD6_9FLAO|nr:hypothetical protein [Chryseobacterium antibioticum]NML69087.1 hypothetical protein [Chryseobacterium antibioticum]